MYERSTVALFHASSTTNWGCWVRRAINQDLASIFSVQDVETSEHGDEV